MYKTWSVIAESYGSSVFSFLRNLHTALHSGCSNLHSHQQCKRVPCSPHPLQHLLRVDFLMMVMRTGLRWHLTVASLCISLINSNDEHVAMCPLAICRSSLEKCLFSLLPVFLIGWFFCCWVVWAFCIFRMLSSCWSHHLQILPPRLCVVFLFC